MFQYKAVSGKSCSVQGKHIPKTGLVVLGRDANLDVHVERGLLKCKELSKKDIKKMKQKTSGKTDATKKTSTKKVSATVDKKTTTKKTPTKKVTGK